MAIARAILSKRPYIILDEATSSLDEKNESEIYQILQESETTMVSISHRPQVIQFHTHVLNIDGKKGWKIMDVEKYLAKQEAIEA